MPDHVCNGGALLADLLNRYGFEYVFGVPSEAPELIAPLWRNGKPRYVVIRDERAAPFAANVYTRLTGRLAVIEAAPSVGSLLTLPGLAEALNASVPMLALFTDVSQMSGPKRERGVWNQSTDQLAIFREAVKYCAAVPRIEKLPEYLAYALQVATSGRPGPVALVIPADVLAADARGVETGVVRAELATVPSTRRGTDPFSVRSAAQAIAASERPVILAGGGTVLSGAGPELVRLAESAGIPVATTLSGSGSIDEYHPLSVGTAGFYGVDAASQVLERADTILLVGAKGSGYSTWLWRYPRHDQEVIRIDVDEPDPNSLTYEARTLCGDAKRCLEDLRQALAPLADSLDRADWHSQIARLRDAWTARRENLLRAGGASERLTSAADVVRELDRRVEPGDVLISEASAATGWASLVRTPAGAQRIAFRGLGILGGTVGGALGACLAESPQRRVIQFTGDGAMGYQIGECVTISRLGLKVISIVLNNSVLGAVRVWPGMPPASAEIGTIDFAAAARACGWIGLNVRHVGELASALDLAFSSDQPVLLDVIVDPDEWADLAFKDGRLVPSYDAS